MLSRESGRHAVRTTVKRLSLFLLLVSSVGCANLHRVPSRWVSVVEVGSGRPVPGVPLVYHDVLKPYFIVGTLVTSQEYVANERGRAHVPAGECMMTAQNSAYECVAGYELGRMDEEMIRDDIIYVKLRDHPTEYRERSYYSIWE